ncbi:MAG: hypothetical protein ABIH69_06780, partial [bacterium]
MSANQQTFKEVLKKYRFLGQKIRGNFLKITAIVIGLVCLVFILSRLSFNFSPSQSRIEIKLDPAIAASIQKGVAKQRIYIDSYYSDEPGDLSRFANFYICYDGFFANKDKLYKSGLLIMRYGMKKPQLQAQDFQVVQTYIASGGRVLLLCPAWVYKTYEKKEIQELSFYQIAKEFGVILTADYADPPLQIVEPAFMVKNFANQLEGVFGKIVGEEGQPILVGKNG